MLRFTTFRSGCWQWKTQRDTNKRNPQKHGRL